MVATSATMTSLVKEFEPGSICQILNCHPGLRAGVQWQKQEDWIPDWFRDDN